jgi:hypothetical protein
VDEKENGNVPEAIVPPEVELRNPLCPHCGHDLTDFGNREVQLGGKFIALILWCKNDKCRKFLGMQMIGEIVQRSSIHAARDLPFNPTRKM